MKRFATSKSPTAAALNQLGRHHCEAVQPSLRLLVQLGVPLVCYFRVTIVIMIGLPVSQTGFQLRHDFDKALRPPAVNIRKLTSRYRRHQNGIKIGVKFV